MSVDRSLLWAGVAAAMRDAAATAIMPRFRRLGPDEVIEKSPGELVSSADREAERLIAPLLTALLPGSRVIGEEAVANDPGLLDGLGGGVAWLVDPLDGTANFIAGEERFAVMVALLVDGRTEASWMLDPCRDLMAHAWRGQGAFLGDHRLRGSDEAPPPRAMRGAALTRFLPPTIRTSVERARPGLAALLPGMRCSGLEYPAIATGEQDFVLFWRTLPWDHAPGALLVQEAGGRAARPDGTPYDPTDSRAGLLVARSDRVWELARTMLLGDGAPGPMAV